MNNEESSTVQTTAHNRGAAQMVSYDLNTLEQIASSYPEAMREPFFWLAEFVREKCSRNLNTLEQKLREMGIPTTSGTVSKILRGRWNLDAKRNKVSPIMAQDKFIAMVERLQASPDLADPLSDIPFIETPTYKTIENYITVRRHPGRVCKFGFIVGPTGAQKTACCKHFKSKYPRSVAWVEAPEKPSLTRFIADAADQYRVSDWQSVMQKMLKIRENLTTNKVMIIENVQRLYKQPDGRDLIGASQPIFSYIQKLQDETGFVPIFTATPAFYQEFLQGISKGYFEQFEGRVGGRSQFLVLPAYAPREDIEVISDKFGLEPSKENVDYLERIARLPGRIRILFQTLQDAKQEADDSGVELSLDHVKELMPESFLMPMKEAA